MQTPEFLWKRYSSTKPFPVRSKPCWSRGKVTSEKVLQLKTHHFSLERYSTTKPVPVRPSQGTLLVVPLEEELFYPQQGITTIGPLNWRCVPWIQPNPYREITHHSQPKAPDSSHISCSTTTQVLKEPIVLYAKCLDIQWAVPCTGDSQLSWPSKSSIEDTLLWVPYP